ncbi:hypothetical protein JTB14_012579 [Gonioctena quinquepunctata]|nr:hypothetical protein JTB14_012579 [Gonioctena quinquepunctata]
MTHSLASIRMIHVSANYELISKRYQREGITIDNLQVLASPNNKHYHLFCTTGERSPERRKEYLVLTISFLKL